MNPADEAWLSLLLAALFGTLIFLRLRFPNASRSRETAVLAVATILFFSICNFFLGSPAARASTISNASSHMLKR